MKRLPDEISITVLSDRKAYISFRHPDRFVHTDRSEKEALSVFASMLRCLADEIDDYLED